MNPRSNRKCERVVGRRRGLVGRWRGRGRPWGWVISKTKKGQK